MKEVTVIEGIAAAFLQPNVDTEVIIRIEHLMNHGRGELGPYCLEAVRYRLDHSEVPDFPLNQSRARGATILLAGENFGCGSSPEAAVWSLMDYGFSCIISSSFGDIFYNNCLQNGLLPVIVPGAEVHRLADELQHSRYPKMRVDLIGQRVISASGRELSFSIDAGQR